MRRRLDLAAALVAGPPVLFLDEPTTGLDPQSRQDLWGVIEDLVAEGTTVLLTTQYLEEADRLARDIVVVDHGRVIAEGTPAELKADLGTSVIVGHPRRRRRRGRRRPAARSALATRAPVVDGATVELTVENGPAVGAEVLRALDAAQIAVAGLALREPSLDDVFLSLTGHKTEAETDAGARRRAEPAIGDAPRTPPPRTPTERTPHEHHRLPRDAVVHPARPGGQPPRWAVQDTLTVTWRNLHGAVRTPETVFFSAIQPIMFVLLFVYVFGGAIHIPGVPYVDYLMPGHLRADGDVRRRVPPRSGLAEDLQKGLIERFRALPMARSAVLAGRTTADLVRNVFVVLLITAVGFAVGFRIGTDFGLFLCGLLIVCFLLHAVLGLRHRRPDGPQRRDGAAHGLPHPVPVHLRLVGLRAGERDAGLAAGLRQAPAGDPGGRRRPARS